MSTISNLLCRPKAQHQTRISIQLDEAGLKWFYTTGDVIKGVTTMTVPSGSQLESIRVTLEGKSTIPRSIMASLTNCYS